MSDASGSIAHGVTMRGPPPGAADLLTLTVGNQQLTGWQRVSVTRPLAAIPASFSIEVTERYPNAADIDLKAGAPCTVTIGSDLVLTGYVDRYTSSISAAQHTIRVEGRSKSQDLVDCSAIVENTSAGSAQTQGLQILNGDAISIARKLAKPYGIEIQTTFAGPLPTLPQLNIMLGETVWEIIDRVTRYSELIPYDLPDGSVVMFACVGTASMASGFRVGDNVEAADVMFSMDQRYSEYEGHVMSMMALGTDAGVNSPGVGKIIKDEEVPRFRKLYIISEQTMMGVPLAEKRRAQWPKSNRRWGQSFNFTVTTATVGATPPAACGEPNIKLAPIEPQGAEAGTDETLADSRATVTYTRDEGGQHARLSLFPPEAFTVEPTTPNYLVTNESMDRNNPTAPNADTKVPPAPAAAPGKVEIIAT